MLRWSEQDVAAHKARLKRGRGEPDLPSEPSRRLKATRGKETLFSQAIAKGISPQVLLLTVSLPPSVNHCYANATSSNRRVLTTEGKQYKRDVENQVAIEASSRKFKYAEGERISLSLNLYFADNRRDISNTVKLLEDAIASAIGFNDRVVDRLNVERKGFDKQNPRCEVTLMKICGVLK